MRERIVRIENEENQSTDLEKKNQESKFIVEYYWVVC